MGANISYMGTKREMASSVADVLGSAKPGIAFDVFAGMCSVAEAVAPVRPIWTNDIQHFAFTVANCLFNSQIDPPDGGSASNIYFDAFDTHRKYLSDQFSESLEAERFLVGTDSFEDFALAYTIFKKALEGDIQACVSKDFSFFTRTYSDSYFGLRQAIEIDAVSASVRLSGVQNAIWQDLLRWNIVAMGRAALRISNSTGHFAQYLQPKEKSYKVFLRQRRRSFWKEWLTALGELSPVGTIEWRNGNQSFNRDTMDLLPGLVEAKIKPSVVYADPPYTDDQYSRFYHVLETISLYDLPKVEGKARYRTDRFRTPFSVKSTSAEALDLLARDVAALQADFVLSYPQNGLIYKRGLDPLTIVSKYFRRVECRSMFERKHSTFGASKGAAKHDVTEQLFLARN